MASHLVSDQSQISVTHMAQALYEAWPANYDQQLLQDCGYRSPARAARLLAELCVSMRYDRPWVDLGAGTGLLGQALQQAGLALPLIAVDCSRAMLANIVHEPYVACAALDVLDTAALRTLPVSGAVALGLTEHIVDLSALFAACAALLPHGAPFVFSYCPLLNGTGNAANDDAANEYAVFESFANLHAHTPNHVARTLAASSFSLLSEHDGPGYTTAGQPVTHRLVVARRH